MQKSNDAVQSAVAYIKSRISIAPSVGLILGSGLGDLAEKLESPQFLESRSIPGYPASTIEGHRGRLGFSLHAGIGVVAFQGRVHYFESGNSDTVLFPLRTARGLGVNVLIVTNAAGGVNPMFEPGDLMLIEDQINLTLLGLQYNLIESGQVNIIYDNTLADIARTISRSRQIPLRSGVYAGVQGPSYETAAEVRMVGKLGGDAVGMSTVLETAYARSVGMRVLGISCITNKATGIGSGKLNHAEVTVAAERAKKNFTTLILGVLSEIAVRDLARSPLPDRH